MGTAGHDRAPAQQGIPQALAGLEEVGIEAEGGGGAGARARRQGPGGVVGPVAPHLAEGLEQAIKGQAKFRQPLPIKGRHRDRVALLPQLADGDPQGLARVLHAGGGGGHQGHPRAIPAAVAGRQDLGLQSDGIEHLPADGHQHIREGPQADPAPLQAARIGAPVLAARHDPVGVGGIDLVVADGQARLARESIPHHPGLPEGEVAGGGPAWGGFPLRTTNAPEEMHEQGPLPQAPARRRLAGRNQGRAQESAPLEGCRAPVIAVEEGHGGFGAGHHLRWGELEKGIGMERLNGEHPIGRRGPLDQPALPIQR